MIKPIFKYGTIIRLLEIDDAEFILKLRSDPERNKFISYTSPNLHDQIKWIKNYKIREKQGLEYYFVGQDLNEIKYGTIRLCNFDEISFEIGSWVFLPNSPLGIAVKSHIIGIETGFELLNADYCRLTVRKKNTGVLRYLKTFKPITIKDDGLNFYLALSKQNFYDSKNKLASLFQNT